MLPARSTTGASTRSSYSVDFAVIETGLEVGETVVTDGQFRLVPGSRVDMRTAPAAGEKNGG